MGACFLFIDGHLLAVSSYDGRSKRSLWGPFLILFIYLFSEVSSIRTLMPFMRAPSW